MSEQQITNILTTGVGGQGVMTAAEVLARTALAEGYDVKKTETAGMSQRGGMVTSHVRFGATVLSPGIPIGEADILVGFEPVEALRWCGYLRPSGVAMVNTVCQVPPVVSLGLYDYPADPTERMRAGGIEVHAFDAGAIARRIGDTRLVNTVMLGAIAKHLPFSPESLKEQILARFRQHRPELVTINEEAFEAGRTIDACG